MMRIEKILVVIVVLFVSMLAFGVAHAQAPSALVLEKSGASVPEIKPYSEIPVSTTVSLKSGARLVFLHYHTCQTVTVVASTITFGAEAYTITGGKKESETRSPCPRTVALKAGGEMGGVLMRSGAAGTIAKFSRQPTFVLVGKRADDFASIQVLKDEKSLLEARLDGPRFRWPTNTPPLAGNTDYEMVLIPKVSGAAPVKMSFFVTVSTEAPASEAMVLLRVE